MIPKTIHYCWFGGREKPKLAQKCIASWRKYCSDYEIIEWNEHNFNTYINEYTSFTFEKKLYAYLSDYVRLWAVYTCGGLYFDTDVELIKSPDPLLSNAAYFGFEDDRYVNTGLGFGAEKENDAVRNLMLQYEKNSIIDLSNTFDSNHCLTGSPKMNTIGLIELGLVQNGKYQTLNGVEIYPKEYFCPFDDVTGILKTTSNTYSIHWFSKSAQGKFSYYKSKITRVIHRIIDKK